ncbi:cytochrome b/b6 domain-containing protein [Azospirillum halopraeferens]|uniref:cytochrome b/b6 domain-containing protein n=1 Tax=Azospirillum halopraeferens TaxID=34010 RepID=UPI0003FDA195|nr:cytochrome b/b6 domain-containing protein [Azospirillum halopraeferens]
MPGVYVYKRFERFWHWSQAALVLSLMATGGEVHGLWHLLGWGRAAQIHSLLAYALLILWAFAIFWHFTTGEWRQYVPTLHRLTSVARFYAVGIFRGEHHPYHKTVGAKLNPLQRLAYLFLKLVINPLLIVSGVLYLYINEAAVRDLGLSLEVVALIHTAAAFLMAAFVIAHVYLTTTGHSVFAHIRAMITGWEDLDHPAPAGSTDTPRPPDRPAPAE